MNVDRVVSVIFLHPIKDLDIIAALMMEFTCIVIKVDDLDWFCVGPVFLRNDEGDCHPYTGAVDVSLWCWTNVVYLNLHIISFQAAGGAALPHLLSLFLNVSLRGDGCPFRPQQQWRRWDSNPHAVSSTGF